MFHKVLVLFYNDPSLFKNKNRFSKSWSLTPKVAPFRREVDVGERRVGTRGRVECEGRVLARPHRGGLRQQAVRSRRWAACGCSARTWAGFCGSMRGLWVSTERALRFDPAFKMSTLHLPSAPKPTQAPPHPQSGKAKSQQKFRHFFVYVLLSVFNIMFWILRKQLPNLVCKAFHLMQALG